MKNKEQKKGSRYKKGKDNKNYASMWDPPQK